MSETVTQIPEGNADSRHGKTSRLFNGLPRRILGYSTPLVTRQTFFDPRSITDLRGDEESGMPDRTYKRGLEISITADNEMRKDRSLLCIKVEATPLELEHHNIPSVNFAGYEYVLVTDKTGEPQTYSIAEDLSQWEVDALKDCPEIWRCKYGENTDAVADFVARIKPSKLRQEGVEKLNAALVSFGQNPYEPATSARAILDRAKEAASKYPDFPSRHRRVDYK